MRTSSLMLLLARAAVAVKAHTGQTAPAVCARRTGGADWRDVQPTCGEAQFTECSSAQILAAGVQCPRRCPFLVVPEAVACAYYCVAAEACTTVNPALRFPNNRTGKCEACGVTGCSRCASSTACAECYSAFQWDEIGEGCVYTMDLWIKGPVVVLCLLVLLLAVVVPVCLWRGRKNRQRHFSIKDPDQKGADRTSDRRIQIRGVQIGRRGRRSQFHTTILQLARKHHHWCKVRDWYHQHGAHSDRLASCAGSGTDLMLEPWPRHVSFLRNLHNTYLLGLGMPLYYNFLVFMASLFILLLVLHTFMSWLWLDSPVFSRLDSWRSNEAELESCSAINTTLVGEYRNTLGHLYIVELTVLYVIGLCAVVAFALFQKSRIQKFTASSSTMRRYALMVRGYPEDATDEVAVKNNLEKDLSIKLGRPVSLAYVSICYDVNSNPGFAGKLNRLLDRLIAIEDVRRNNYSHEYADTAEDAKQVAREAGVQFDLPAAQLTRTAWLSAASTIFRREVEELLGEGGSKMRNAGQAFAVFDRAEDARKVVVDCDGDDFISTSDSFLAPSLRGTPLDDVDVISTWTAAAPPAKPQVPAPVAPLGQGSLGQQLLASDTALKNNLLITPLINEPVSVGWEHFGKSRAQRVKEVSRAALNFLLFYVLVWYLVLHPALVYVRDYSTKVHDNPGGIVSKFFGIVVGTSNWLICMCIATRGTGAGFLWKDREEVFVYCCFIFMCVANTLMSLWYTVVSVYMAEVHATTVDWETRVASDIASMLFPGSFIPCLLWPLQGFLWPFLEAFLDLRFRNADDLTVRVAERRLEPLPVGLAWDYQGSLTCPVLGFLTIFFASNGLRWSLLFLALWTLFFYCVQHFNHLRMAKTAYTTSNRLDTAVLWSWGLVLGEILAGAAFWGSQVRGWPRSAVPAALVAGTALLWLILGWGVRPTIWTGNMIFGSEDRDSPTLQDTRERTLFDWANCNPGLVLKSQIVDLRDAGIPRLLPFAVGKSHAWKAQDRSREAGGTPFPECSRLWYEPGELYRRLGIIA